MEQSELPAPVLRVLQRAASHSADGKTVALVFATNDFAELVLNWCLTAVRAGVRWFTVVAMDESLRSLLVSGGSDAPAVLLPRAQRRLHGLRHSSHEARGRRRAARGSNHAFYLGHRGAWPAQP